MARIHLNGSVGATLDGVGEAICSFVAQHWRLSERGKMAGEAARVLLVGGVVRPPHYISDSL